MAPKRKTRKPANTHKKKYNKQRQKQVKDNGLLQDEIIIVVSLVISILLFLSNFNLCGTAGKAVSDFVFGMVGMEAYILPLIIFFLTAFHISNMGNKKAGRKILSAFTFLVALDALLQMITNSDKTISILDYYMASMKNRNGGGIIGGIFAKLFVNLFDKVATYIILIAVMIISFIVITGKAFFTYIAATSRKSFEERREYQRLRKEELAEEAARQQNEADRRPPKTFVVEDTTPASLKKSIADGSATNSEAKASVIDLKDKKAKKEKTSEEKGLPFLNFHGLFDDAKKDKKEEDVPTYEDELRLKFGKSEQPAAEAEDETVESQEDTAVVQNITPFAEVKPAQENEIKPNIDFAQPDMNLAQPDGNPDQTEQNTDRSTENSVQNIHKDKSSGTVHKSEDTEQLNISQETKQKEYIFPPLNLLNAPKSKANKGGSSERDLKETAMKLQSTLDSFGVNVTITNVSVGPAVTRYELQPEQGVKVSKITSLSDDIKLNLAAADIRIEAPIPGKAAVGIEVPNKENSMVPLREMIESREFTGHPSDVAFAVGKDIGGQIVITDIAKMPHLLIAGATGSGKSVCINTLIMSILYKAKPADVRLIMVDPKVVELNVYNGIPHLLIPVVTDPKKASAALNWAVMEMTERYKKFADVGARDLKSYNEKVSGVAYLNDENVQKLPQIVIIIDELADLMMVAPSEVEDAICRLAQLARAAGIHLIIATQRPSVNVITGLIKANIPSRIAFAVSSAVDSRTIIDGSGAEKLLGKGDMLFFPSGYPKPVRIQGAFVSDKEVSSVVEFLKKHNNEAVYSDDIHEKINSARPGDLSLQGGDDRDEYFAEAGKFIIEKDKASIGMLQRVYKIGFNRAARIMDQLSDAGVVGPEEGTKPRKILMSMEQFEEYLSEN